MAIRWNVRPREANRALAETLGLRGVVWTTTERRGRLYKIDVITGEPIINEET